MRCLSSSVLPNSLETQMHTQKMLNLLSIHLEEQICCQRKAAYLFQIPNQSNFGDFPPFWNIF